MNINEIKNRREELGVTQAELARVAGVFPSFVSRVESGKIDPHLSTMNRLMDALDQIEENRILKLVLLNCYK